ncbi:hypothetical protein HELRODRAFT_162645 [Helobdella robusta]|uniref:DOP1 N-terminal domain-containing protein n=1 Tax=Helobdella robusta TaxID=6412 RepID=T1ESY8_HELRO|nr:hypothetical protein HELRODRAFT_162645 [Helobdella robusta]ESN99151.1 hypothetical protein HELRODRAFT_162645 [Helobdella robusta]
MNNNNKTTTDITNDSNYKKYTSAIDSALRSFENTSEWADLIAALGKLNKVLNSYSKYTKIPRKVLIGKRLAQCLHPSLPNGVHLKALETYNIIFRCIGPHELSLDIFIYSCGLFPLLSYAAINVRPVLLSIYENHFVPLNSSIRPAMTGLLMGLLPGFENASEYFERMQQLLESFSECVDKSHFYTCMWECINCNSAVRCAGLNFIIMHFDKKQSMEDQIYLMGTNICLLIHPGSRPSANPAVYPSEVGKWGDDVSCRMLAGEMAQ